MRIAFLMPCYPWVPSGGFRVVYEYANRLVARSHEVTVVHPQSVSYPPPDRLSVYGRIRKTADGLRDYFARPSISWQKIDPRVKLSFVRNSDARYIPDGDAVFATAWHTVRSVLECPKSKGEKFYLIQHYETWQGPKDQVDATWRAPLHKVVVARWLVELGEKLGSEIVSYIPNAIDHQRFQITQPIENRRQRVAMMFSKVAFKGADDGIEAIEIARRKYPNLKAVFFGLTRIRPSVPRWIDYHNNPSQEFLANEIYNKSSIFLSSSFSEGFSLPPAEAASSGCAVVSTDNGGIREYITDKVTGLLSPPRNPAALAENLCLLLANDELRIKLAKAAHQAVSDLSWEQSASLLENVLLDVLRRKSNGPKELSPALLPVV